MISDLERKLQELLNNNSENSPEQDNAGGEDFDRESRDKIFMRVFCPEEDDSLEEENDDFESTDTELAEDDTEFNNTEFNTVKSDEINTKVKNTDVNYEDNDSENTDSETEDENNSVTTETKSIKSSMQDIFNLLENEINNSNSPDDVKQEMKDKLNNFCNTKTNIMLVGATGCGKSSTINALFGCSKDMKDSDYEVAKVGCRVDPETKDIEKYVIGNLILWDTPGLGDGTELDEHHKEVIQELLCEEDDDGNKMIDLVLVILDGSTKDLGTSYKILNEVIIPELDDEVDRILVALNQADIAMKTGRHWDFEKNEPDDVLMKFLDEKVESIRARIREDSGIEIEPIYYCAGYKEENGDVVYPYNLSKLLYYILSAIPAYKRVAVMESVNEESDNFEFNDDEMNYSRGVKYRFSDSFDEFISEGVDRGADIGETILGIPGAIVGAIIGGTVGCIKSILDDIFE